MADTNWNAGLSTAGTVLSTAANIYTAINNGKIKAIEMKMEADQRASQQKIAGMETSVKLQELDTKYQEQLAGIADKYSQATENQQLTAMMQGRTMDSLSSIQSTDKRAMQEDKQINLLNKQSGKAALETERDVSKIQSDADVQNLKTAGEMAKLKSYADAGSSLLKGTTTLAKNNAFDPDYYTKNKRKDT